MVDQAYVQSKVFFGYSKAATILGASYTQYRPIDPLNPLGNSLGSLKADFDIDPKFSYKAPSLYGKPIYYGLFDGTNAQIGDYLIGPGNRTFFVANIEPIRPPLCVSCNRTLSVSRKQLQAVGPGFYGGESGDAVILMKGWPGSELQGVRGEKGPANLPGDTRLPWANFLMPAFPGLTIEMADQVSDDIGRTYTISSAELTELGWRLTAILADT